MEKIIKKYKNRRLYDTDLSKYITLEELYKYVLEGIVFKVVDSESEQDLTNIVLLQIIVEMEAGPTKFLSTQVLRQIISLANHPMHQSLKGMMEKMFAVMDKPLASNPFQQATDAWNNQMQQFMAQWPNLFKN
jgi:polyhydroxyalkanoate synthesis repressor PhaR